MFPDTTDEVLVNAMIKGGNLLDAVNILLEPAITGMLLHCM